VTFPICFTTADGREVSINGPASWSDSYFSVTIDGVPTCRPRALIETLIPTPNERNDMARTTKNATADPVVDEGNIVAADPQMTPAQQKAKDENHELSVDEDVKENSTQENAAAVAKATAKSSPAPEKDSTPEKPPTTGEVAGAWIRNQLEDGPKTKPELIELAAKNNPAKFPHPSKEGVKVPRSTKWIIENKKIGTMIPGNAGGHYVSEGLDSHKGGVDVLIDEKTKALSLKS
jgi:hypothetical protein